MISSFIFLNFMKFFKNIIFMVMVFVLGVFNASATESPPPPPPARTSAPPPIGLELPIDENILILMMMALLLGIYIICRHSIKNKAAI